MTPPVLFYNFIQMISDEKIILIVNGKAAIVNKENKLIKKYKNEIVIKWDDNTYVFGNGVKFGLMNGESKILIPSDYTNLFIYYNVF